MKHEYAKGLSNTNFFSENDFYVNNVGYHKNETTDMFCDRPFGRRDYHFILCVSGEIIANGQTVTAGNGYLYYPLSAQSYVYKAVSGCEYFWIHFSGSKIKSTLDNFGVTNGVIKLKENTNVAVNILKLMLSAYSLNYNYAEEFSAGLLSSLLALLASPISVPPPYYKALRVLNEVTDNTPIKELAKISNMSEGHFIREFKSAIGVSPLTYRLQKRINVAKELLYETNLSVSEVAYSVGYEDPLYFSRQFKLREGVSPLEYRRLVKKHA